MRLNPKTLAGASAAALTALGLVLAAPAIGAGPIVLSPAGVELAGGPAVAKDASATQMKRYRNAKWDFALDVPAGWNALPPGSGRDADDVKSPYEVVRFAKLGDPTLMSVYRMPYDPALGPAASVSQTQATLAKDGYSHFVGGETAIGRRRVLTLDGEKRQPGGETWHVRAYHVVDGTLEYVLGFGAADPATLSGVDDRVAKSFTFGETS